MLHRLKYKFDWLRVYFSPFKPPTPKLYMGKTKVGMPYFIPRVYKKGKFVDKKVGFDFVPLIWKTKWTSEDFRFECSPRWSFVFFGFQIAVVFQAVHEYHFWECWLYYRHATDKSKSTRGRLKQAKEEFPQTWVSHEGGVETSTDYWGLVVKRK